MTTVTDEQVTETIRAVVEEYGEDYIYPTLDGSGCYYAYNGEPSCLVGKVLHRLGADIHDLERCDELGGINEEVLKRVNIKMSKAAQLALRAAQRMQDVRNSWGFALTAYLSRIGAL